MGSSSGWPWPLLLRPLTLSSSPMVVPRMITTSVPVSVVPDNPSTHQIPTATSLLPSKLASPRSTSTLTTPRTSQYFALPSVVRGGLMSLTCSPPPPLVSLVTPLLAAQPTRKQVMPTLLPLPVMVPSSSGSTSRK